MPCINHRLFDLHNEFCLKYHSEKELTELLEDDGIGLFYIPHDLFQDWLTFCGKEGQLLREVKALLQLGLEHIKPRELVLNVIRLAYLFDLCGLFIKLNWR